MKISIFGVGYVGLVSGACFAELGNEVLCCDINAEKISDLKNGIIPIFEPGLKDIVDRNVKSNRLFFTTKAEEAVKFGDIIFIAVGTPPKEHGQADLKYVYTVAETIGEYLDKDQKIIVDKSTVPVGTAEEVRTIIGKKLSCRGQSFNFAVVSNPEFLKEGDAINDFMKPDRVVVGCDKDWAKKIMEDLYLPVTKNGHSIFFMDLKSAEMTKYAANALLATKISFMNQMANLCEMTGADIEQVRKGICADRRIGPHFLYPGCGYGGSCFPKDVQALASLSKKFGYTPQLLDAVENINETQKEILAKKIVAGLGDLISKKIAVWGLAFKPQTDDMREAPAIITIERLLAKGARISAYDPVAMKEAKKIFRDRIDYAFDMYDCLRDADALVVITEWPEFKLPDFAKIKSLLRAPIIFDGRNIYSPEKMKELGFKYFCIGRPVLC
ncbi:MAG: UDP-glucose/GDP-mannose dehydrogenase family protein [Candidatus Falkowbacteria bacterium]